MFKSVEVRNRKLEICAVAGICATIAWIVEKTVANAKLEGGWVLFSCVLFVVTACFTLYCYYIMRNESKSFDLCFKFQAVGIIFEIIAMAMGDREGLVFTIGECGICLAGFTVLTGMTDIVKRGKGKRAFLLHRMCKVMNSVVNFETVVWAVAVVCSLILPDLYPHLAAFCGQLDDVIFFAVMMFLLAVGIAMLFVNEKLVED